MSIATLISVDKASLCLNSRANPVPVVITWASQEIERQQMFLVDDREMCRWKPLLLHVIFSLFFQLCQMLPPSGQIPPEQKEDHRQEEHDRPHLQWNVKGDGLEQNLCWP